MIEEKNKLYSLWLNTGEKRYKNKSVVVHSDARRAIKLAKEAWFSCKAEEVQREGDTMVKYCGRDIQRVEEV